MKYAIGFVWVCMGFFLLYKGVELGNEWLPAALVVGLLKGRYVMAKSAERALARMRAQLPPFPKAYLGLVAVMVLMGVGLRYVPQVWRGFVDAAVGAALIRGGLVFFIGGKGSPARSPETDRVAPGE